MEDYVVNVSIDTEVRRDGMALIKCSECGKEISDTAKRCPNCGYKDERKAKRNKKIFIIPVSIVVILMCIFCILKLIDNNNSPANQTIKIIELDYGKNINITSIFYNEEQNGCIIEFSSGGVSDVACVHLKDKTIGYESVYENMSEKSNDLSLSDSDKQKYAVQIIEYPYDAMWVYDLFANGTSGSKWEKVQ